MIEPSAFRLTGKNVYGWDYIYDTEIRMVYPWNAWDDDGEKWGLDDKPIYSHIQPVPPREAFQPLIDSFRRLTRLAGSEIGVVEMDESSPDRFSPSYPDEARIGELKLYEADLKVWKAKCGIADLYLECGWEVDLITQTHFRRAEFVEQRAKYASEVLEPLRKERDKAVKSFQEHYRDHTELQVLWCRGQEKCLLLWR